MAPEILTCPNEGIQRGSNAMNPTRIHHTQGGGQKTLSKGANCDEPPGLKCDEPPGASPSVKRPVCDEGGAPSYFHTTS